MESLEGLERTRGELRLSANGGELHIVFPERVWARLLDGVPTLEDPEEHELEELDGIQRRLEAHAEDRAFEEVSRATPYGGFKYDLVLRPAGLYALTTGYHFAPLIKEDLIARIGSSLRRDAIVEQAYAIGAVASEGALRAGDENLKVLSVRGRRCTASRFEMAPELWQVLSRGLGWRDVETFVNERNH